MNKGYKFYAPTFSLNDTRIDLIARAVEQSWPNLSLDRTISKNSVIAALGFLPRVRNRRKTPWYYTSERKIPAVATLCNNQRKPNHKWQLEYWIVESMFANGFQTFSFIEVESPDECDIYANAMKNIGVIGDAAKAWHGTFNPSQARKEFVKQYSVLEQVDAIETDNGLPILRDVLHKDFPKPSLPDSLGWINYWSGEVANFLGFPDPNRDQELLTRCVHTERNAWVVKLTEEPLDFGRTEHLAAVQAAYQRFNKLGVRI